MHRRRLFSRVPALQSFIQETLDLLDKGSDLPDSTYAALLRECGSTRALQQGKRVHQHMISKGQSRNSFLGNLLVQMYGKCGSLDDAKLAFDAIPEWNVYSWGLMISAYAHKGQHTEAVDMFRRMQEQGFHPDCFITASVLAACTSLGDVETGETIHGGIVSGSLEANLVVETALLNMYAKTRRVDQARKVFDSMATKDVVCWNAMLAAYAHTWEAVQLYHRMNCEGVRADEFTFSTVLGACSSLKDLKLGKAVHAVVVECGMEQEDGVSCALVSMFSRCGSLKDTERVFQGLSRKTVVSWTGMMAAYVHLGHHQESLKLYHRMNMEGILQPNNVTFATLLSACSVIGPASLLQGCQLHKRLRATGFEPCLVIRNSLITMYARCGSLSRATEVFEGMPDEDRDLVSWNAMLAAYVQLGEGAQALDFYGRMGIRDVQPDEVTFTSVLGGCTKVGDLDQGRRIHAQLKSTKFIRSPAIQTALVNMYAKCAGTRYLRNFALPHALDLVYCNSLIGAHALYGHAGQALKFFRKMQLEGVEPNGITFISLLAACSRSCWYKQGGEIFRSLRSDYGMTPKVDHYRCMIHLLGRSGFVRSAKELIERMEYEPSDMEWTSLLGTCRLHGSVWLGREAARRALELNPGNETAYVLLLNLNSAAYGLSEARRKWRKETRRVKRHGDRSPPKKAPTWKTFEELRHRKKNPYIEKLVWRGSLKKQNRRQLAFVASKKVPTGPLPMKRFRGFIACETWGSAPRRICPREEKPRPTLAG